MIRSIRFALAAGAGLAVALATPAAAADALPCAEWVTSQFNDGPATGFLIGTETRTETFTYTIHATPGGMGSTVTYTKTVTYEVGVYQISNGENAQLDCRDYSQLS